MPQTITTVKLLQDVCEAYDRVCKTLSRAEHLPEKHKDKILTDKIRQLKADKSRLEQQAMYYGLDLKNPQAGDLGGLAMVPILPLAVIANIALGNALFVSGLVKEKVPFTVVHGLQVGLGGLLIVLLIPVVVNAFKKARGSP